MRKKSRKVNNDRLTAHQLAAFLLNGPDLPVGVTYEDCDNGGDLVLSYLFESVHVSHEITHGDDRVVILAMLPDPTTTAAATTAAFGSPTPATYVASTLV